MSTFEPSLAAIRFGTGLSPVVAAPASAAAMLSALNGPDRMAARFPIGGLGDLAADYAAFREMRLAQPDARARRPDELRFFTDLRKRETARAGRDMVAAVVRGVVAEDGFRERLCLFWADHFAVAGRGRFLRHRTDAYVEEAIRPHIAGRFADLLKAAELHPVMLTYLDQIQSVGPDSPFARNAANRNPDRPKGLNENLAREIMELHTLGVHGSYSQTDVRQFAELLAGVTLDGEGRMAFLPARSEPGAETVVGYTSTSGQGRLDDVLGVLDRLAAHPDTADHIARKLAVHFVADDPDPGLVAAMAGRFRETGGDLTAVYEALLTHPAAMVEPMVKVKRPAEYVISALRALGADAGRMLALAEADPQLAPRWIGRPLRFMGQAWGEPEGPNGWPEDASAWISAPALAERIRWARALPGQGVVPKADPAMLLQTALGPFAGQRLAFAAGAAETREEAVALILASPEFQRR